MTLETFFERFDQFADAPDAVGKLRELVLEFAVRGRLVPSREPESSVLSGLFPVPGNWRWSILGEVADPCGQTKPDSRFTYVDVGAIDNVRGRITDSVQQLEAADAPSRARKLVRPGSVLYATVRPYLRNVAIFERQFSPPAIVSTAFAVLCPHPSLDVRYLFYWLRSQSFQDEVTERMKGVAYPAISDSEFWRCQIPLPPVTEQKQIVEKVGELMSLCDRLEAQQQERESRHAVLARAALARFADAPTPANLQLLFHPSYAISPADLRKTILALAVQGKLVPQDPDDEPAGELLERLSRELTVERRHAAPPSPLLVELLQHEVPDGWTWARFQQVAIIASDLVKPGDFLDFTHLAPDNIEKGNGVLLPCSTVREDKVISSNHRFYSGQIIYSKIRPNLAKVVVVDFEGLCSADMYPIDALIDPFYLQRYMLSESFLVQAVKADTRVAMPKINQTELNAIAVPVPPLAEQRRIVAKVDQLMALVDELERQLSASRAVAADLLTAVVAELTGSPQSV